MWGLMELTGSDDKALHLDKRTLHSACGQNSNQRSAGMHVSRITDSGNENGGDREIGNTRGPSAPESIHW